jgi:hypothetical protein
MAHLSGLFRGFGHWSMAFARYRCCIPAPNVWSTLNKGTQMPATKAGTFSIGKVAPTGSTIPKQTTEGGADLGEADCPLHCQFELQFKGCEALALPLRCASSRMCGGGDKAGSGMDRGEGCPGQVAGAQRPGGSCCLLLSPLPLACFLLSILSAARYRRG